MSVNFSEFEEKIISALEGSRMIDRFSVSEFTQTPNQEVLLKYFEEPSKIDFDDVGLFFVEEGDKVYCPEMKTSITEKGEWLSNKLPPIVFDIDQSGNVRKADECEAMYICIQVAHVIREPEFKNEFEQLVLDYNFEKMAGRDDENLNFRNLLKDWQSFQSVIINIIVSAAKFKISFTKKDTEKFLKDGIEDSMAAELRDLETKIRAINFEYSQGALSPPEVKKLSKIKRLELIDERDVSISKLITDSPVGDLYKALNLSSEYISPIKKKKISSWVQREVDSLISTEEFSSLREDRKQLISKFTRRAYRFEKNSVRKLAVERYLKDPSCFKLPSKL